MARTEANAGSDSYVDMPAGRPSCIVGFCICRSVGQTYEINYVTFIDVTVHSCLSYVLPLDLINRLCGALMHDATGQFPRPRLAIAPGADRKSTRLNSSH